MREDIGYDRPNYYDESASAIADFELVQSTQDTLCYFEGKLTNPLLLRKGKRNSFLTLGTCSLFAEFFALGTYPDTRI